MKKVICMLISCIFTLSVLTAYAAGQLSVNVACTSSTGTLTITGSTADTREPVVYIMISKSDASVISSAELNLSHQVFTYALVESDGSYEKTLVLPSSFTGGYYKTRVYTEGVSDTDEFSYINPNALQQIAVSITPGMSASDIMAILDLRYSELLIDTAFYNASKAMVCNILSANSSNGYDKDSFNKALYGAFAAYELQNNTSIDIVFSNYLSSFMSYENDYLALDANVKAALPEYLASADYLSATFEEIYADAVSILYVRTASDYVTLQNYITSNNVSLGVNLSAYNSHGEYNRDLIMQEMYSRRNEVTLLSDINTVLSNICSKYTNAGTGTSSAPSSSSGFSKDNGGISASFDSTPSNNQTSPGQSGNGQTHVLTDLDGHWSENDVTYLVSNGVVSGYPDSTYKPDNKVSRAEYAKMISAVVSDIAYESASTFNDVNIGDWYFGDVNKLSKVNIITGFNGYFMPGDFITREEAAVMIYRVLCHNGFTLTVPHSFNDLSFASDWAVDALTLLGGAKVLNGFENNISPKSVLTRGEAAAMISNLIKNSFAEVVK